MLNYYQIGREANQAGSALPSDPHPPLAQRVRALAL